MSAPEQPARTREFSLKVKESFSETRFELEMNQPGVIRFELPPAASPRPVGAHRDWRILRQRIRERIQASAEGGMEKFGTKEAALVGAWAYVTAVGDDGEDFGTTEIKIVLKESWDLFGRKDTLHTGDLKLNPWIDQIGKSNRYRLNADGIERAQELVDAMERPDD